MLKSSITTALKILNERSRDRPILLHTDLGFIFRKYAESYSKRETSKDFCDALRHQLSASNIFIPTYNYNFCSNLCFKPFEDESDLGALSNYVLSEFISSRTIVPIYSHCDIAGKTPESDLVFNNKCAFGKSSFFDWFTQHDGIVVFWGCSPQESNTFLHHIERLCCVPYRYEKKFDGIISTPTKISEVEFISYVRPIDIDISYLDQGIGILDEAGLIETNSEHALTIYEAKKAVKEISRQINLDEYTLLTQESRILCSQLLARDDNLREFSEEIISVLIVSDVNLEPIGKAWGKKRFKLSFHYNDSLCLALSTIKTTNDIDYDYVIIIPSYHTLGLNPFSLSHLSCVKQGVDLNKHADELINITNSLPIAIRQKILFTNIIPTQPIASFLSNSAEISRLHKKICSAKTYFLELTTESNYNCFDLPFIADLGDTCLSLHNMLRFRFLQNF